MREPTTEQLISDLADELTPSSEEILDVVMETFGLKRDHALRLIACMDLDALRRES